MPKSDVALEPYGGFISEGLKKSVYCQALSSYRRGLIIFFQHMSEKTLLSCGPYTLILSPLSQSSEEMIFSENEDIVSTWMKKLLLHVA